MNSHPYNIERCVNDHALVCSAAQVDIVDESIANISPANVGLDGKKCRLKPKRFPVLEEVQIEGNTLHVSLQAKKTLTVTLS